MAAVGRIEEFNSDTEDWTQYMERLEHFFVANDVTAEAKNKSTLLTVCGARTYELIRSLCLPDSPGEKTLVQIKDLVSKQQCPPPSVIMERFKFNSRVQRDGESVSEFITVLRKLSEHCNYGDQLLPMLRNRLVCGIRNVKIQSRLLADGKLTFQDAESTALAMEAAIQDTEDLQQSGYRQDRQVNKLQVPEHLQGGRTSAGVKQSGAPFFCYRCGGPYTSSGCRWQNAECFNCRKKGHTAKVCKS